jgi:hypothetical protein
MIMKIAVDAADRNFLSDDSGVDAARSIVDAPARP